MSDVYDIWLYPLQDWWRTVNEMSGFISTGQMGNFIFRPVLLVLLIPNTTANHAITYTNRTERPLSTCTRRATPSAYLDLCQLSELVCLINIK